MKKIIATIIIILCINPFFPIVKADNEIKLEFYYSSECESCIEKLNLIQNDFIKNNSYNNLNIILKDIETNNTYMKEWGEVYDYFPYPFIVVSNELNTSEPVDEFEITVENLNNLINSYIIKDNENTNIESNNIDENLFSLFLIISLITIGIIIIMLKKNYEK